MQIEFPFAELHNVCRAFIKVFIAKRDNNIYAFIFCIISNKNYIGEKKCEFFALRVNEVVINLLISMCNTVKAVFYNLRCHLSDIRFIYYYYFLNFIFQVIVSILLTSRLRQLSLHIRVFCT